MSAVVVDLFEQMQSQPDKFTKRLFAGFLAVALAAGFCEVMMEPIELLDQLIAAEYTRTTGEPQQTRSVVIAEHGIVATSQPLAAQVGLDVLRAGGNAADAAVAASAMMGVVEPMSCGIGGDLFAIYWDAKSGTINGLNASGRSPYALNVKVFRDAGLDQIPANGPLAWSVPGCVDGWSVLLDRFGSQSLKEVLEPSIGYAENGFPVSEIIASSWQHATQHLLRWPDSAETYLIDGNAPRVGQIFHNPRLARTYRAIADQGRDTFYRGQIARQIVQFSQEHGGFFSMRDLEDHTSEWVEPVSTNYRGYDIWELPPNGQGIAVLEIMNILEGHDLSSLGRHSAEYLHLFIEAKKLAFADRARFYADPAGQDLPVQQLISKEYAARQRARIDPNRAATDVPAGDPKLQHGDTIYLAVVDKDRNMCSLIQSLFQGFGSKVTPGDVGFALQNRGALFSLDEQHPNGLAPHKRPFHTIIPAMVTREGRPWLVFGVMGGDMQPQGHVQVLVNMIDFGMNVQAAGDAARVRHAGSATPTGLPMDSDGGRVSVEPGIPETALRGLLERQHRIEDVQGGFGGYQAIQIDAEHGVLHGATESRKDGAAVGY